MNNQELLKSMLQDVINDRMENASVTMHEYFVSKTREVTGLATTQVAESTDDMESKIEAYLKGKAPLRDKGPSDYSDGGDTMYSEYQVNLDSDTEAKAFKKFLSSHGVKHKVDDENGFMIYLPARF